MSLSPSDSRPHYYSISQLSKPRDSVCLLLYYNFLRLPVKFFSLTLVCNRIKYISKISVGPAHRGSTGTQADMDVSCFHSRDANTVTLTLKQFTRRHKFFSMQGFCKQFGKFQMILMANTWRTGQGKNSKGKTAPPKSIRSGWWLLKAICSSRR